MPRKPRVEPSVLEQVARWPDWKRDEFEERSAIMEFDGKMTRVEAFFRDLAINKDRG